MVLRPEKNPFPLSFGNAGSSQPMSANFLRDSLLHPDQTMMHLFHSFDLIRMSVAVRLTVCLLVFWILVLLEALDHLQNLRLDRP